MKERQCVRCMQWLCCVLVVGKVWRIVPCVCLLGLSPCVYKIGPVLIPRFIKEYSYSLFGCILSREKGNKIKGLRSKNRFWEVKSLEPTFLPKFGRPVMFVIDHVT
jgi:hypothetical protein